MLRLRVRMILSEQRGQAFIQRGEQGVSRLFKQGLIDVQ